MGNIERYSGSVLKCTYFETTRKMFSHLGSIVSLGCNLCLVLVVSLEIRLFAAIVHAVLVTKLYKVTKLYHHACEENKSMYSVLL